MIPVLSLIVLIAVIALSIVTKKNAGIIGLIAAYLFAVAAANQGVEINVAKIATGGWPMTVFFIVLSTTFLFGIANINGTTQVLSRNIICLARGNNKLLPLIFFVFGAIISGAGAGARQVDQQVRCVGDRPRRWRGGIQAGAGTRPTQTGT